MQMELPTQSLKSGLKTALFSLLIIGFAQEASAVCNLGQDAGTLASIQFGRLRLSGFGQGSFKVSNQMALSSADDWTFTLTPQNNDLDIQITGKDGNRISGRLHLAQPITGHVIEQGGTCTRTIKLDDGTFKNSTMQLQHLGAQNLFGGTFSIDNQIVSVLDNRNLSDSAASTSGHLQLSTPKASVAGAALILPSMADNSVSVALSQTSPTLVIDVAIGALSATVLNGVLVSKPFALTSSGGLTLVAAGIESSVAAIHVKSAEIHFDSSVPHLSYNVINMTAADASHAYPVPVKASGITQFTADDITGPAKIGNSMIGIIAERLKVEGAQIKATKITLGWGKEPGVLSGAGSIKLNSISLQSVDAEARLTAPQFLGATISNYEIPIASVTVGIKGAKTSPIINGKGVLSSLGLGSLKLLGSAIPFTISGDNTAGLNIDAKVTNASAIFGDKTDEQLKGNFSVFELKSTLLYDSGLKELQLMIPPRGLSGTASLTSRSFKLLGGSATIEDQNLHIHNNEKITLEAAFKSGDLDFEQPNVAIRDLALVTDSTQPPYPIQSAPISKKSDGVSFNLSPNDPVPLHFSVTFELPGFSIVLPPPIHSVNFDVGNLVVEITSVKVDGFRLTLKDFIATPEFEKISIVAGKFTTRTPKAGEAPIQPDISGSASTPIALDSASADIRLTPAPIAMEQLNIFGVTFSASALQYKGPDQVAANAASGDVNIVSLKLPQDPFDGTAKKKGDINATITLRNSAVQWYGSPNGVANVEDIKASLSGDPEKTDGSISLNSSFVGISGGANIPIGVEPDGNRGCTNIVPGDISLNVRNISGNLALTKGKVSGILSSSDVDQGEVKFFGPRKSCGWDQLIETDIPYPCVGTLSFNDLIRICQKKVSATVGMVFSVYAIDIYLQPDIAKFQLQDDGKFGACYLSIAKIWPKVPMIAPAAFSVSPQIPVGGFIADAINGLIEVWIGHIQTLLGSALFNTYSLMNLVGFGKHNPVVNSC